MSILKGARVTFLKRDFFNFSKLLHLAPLRFHCVGGCCMAFDPHRTHSIKRISPQRRDLRRGWRGAEQLLDQLVAFALDLKIFSYPLFCSSGRRQNPCFRERKIANIFSYSVASTLPLKLPPQGCCDFGNALNTRIDLIHNTARYHSQPARSHPELG